MKRLLKQVSRTAFRTLARLESSFDRGYLVDSVPISEEIGVSDLLRHVQPQDRRLRVLEIGSREVTGPSKARQDFTNAGAEYIGFDYYAGRNVDVVGDVHRLSTYIKDGERFDVVYSFACFEHFAMPWIVAVEIAKVLNVGGILFVKTHFSFSAHERPWNFFQYSDMGLRVLFSTALGFECIAAGMSNPIVGRFSSLAEEDLRYQPVRGLYCGSEYLGRKVREVESFDWNRINIEEVVAGTVYPPPSHSDASAGQKKSATTNRHRPSSPGRQD